MRDLGKKPAADVADEAALDGTTDGGGADSHALKTTPLGTTDSDSRLAAATKADSAADKAATEKRANDKAASDAGVDPDSAYMAALSGAAADPRALAALIKQRSR